MADASEWVEWMGRRRSRRETSASLSLSCRGLPVLQARPQRPNQAHQRRRATPATAPATGGWPPRETGTYLEGLGLWPGGVAQRRNFCSAGARRQKSRVSSCNSDPSHRTHGRGQVLPSKNFGWSLQLSLILSAEKFPATPSRLRTTPSIAPTRGSRSPIDPRKIPGGTHDCPTCLSLFLPRRLRGELCLPPAIAIATCSCGPQSSPQLFPVQCANNKSTIATACSRPPTRNSSRTMTSPPSSAVPRSLSKCEQDPSSGRNGHMTDERSLS